MPLTTRCPDHPDAVVDYPEDVFAHASADHRGESPQSVFDRLVRSFQSQVHAQGRDELRIVHCRACGTRYSESVPPGADGADVPVLCEACRVR